MPIPKGARCNESPQAEADRWAKNPNCIGHVFGEDLMKFQREYDLHGASRAAIRLVQDVFETYRDEKGVRLIEALDSWDTKRSG